MGGLPLRDTCRSGNRYKMIPRFELQKYDIKAEGNNKTVRILADQGQAQAIFRPEIFELRVDSALFVV